MNHHFLKMRFITITCLGLILSACGGENNAVSEEPILRPVRTMIVTSPDTGKSREFTAVVDAARKADLSFKVSGEIVKVFVKQGDEIRSGKVLAKLDDTDTKIQLDEAQSSFEKAQADFTRAQKLIQSNTISKSDFDQVKASFNTANAALKAVQNNLAYTELSAPFSGVVARKYVENFEEVNAKQPVFALHDLSKIHLKIDIPESIMVQARPDNPPKLTAYFEAIPDASFPLIIGEVSTAPDEATKTYEVTLVMELPKNRNILPGMTARVVAERTLAESFDANFYLPANVVLKDSRGHYVFTVADNDNGIGTVRRTDVTIGEISQLGIEIFDGVQEGEHVLTAGMSKVSDGMQVRF